MVTAACALARIAGALLQPDVRMPKLSAVNEAAVAAIFAHIHRSLIIELDTASEPQLPADYDIYYWRRRIAACQEPPKSEEDFFLHEKCADLGEWEVPAQPGRNLSATCVTGSVVGTEKG